MEENGTTMRLIERTHYLDTLKSVIHTPDIKVITGIRRSGKSKLLEALRAHIENSIPNANIIHINFNLVEAEDLREYHALHDYVMNKHEAEAENFILIDEVQMCDGFERAINSFHASEMFDIYITGSNAFLLSSDLATLFTGRTFKIEVFPFSFIEFCKYYERQDLDAAFRDYVSLGGMAGSYVYEQTQQKYAYIADVFNTLIVRNIKQRYKIRSDVALDRVADFLMDNISNITSPNGVAKALDSDGNPTDQKTVRKYIEYLTDAFAFYKVRRYDIRGKKYLASGEKYYLADQSFRYAILGTKNMDWGRTYENIVAIELMRRGYEVYAGVLYEKEIDFVAIKRNEKLYIQVSDDIDSDKTFDREISSLMKIRDAYPKLIIARTGHEEYDHEGIKIIDIARWLSNNCG